MVRTIKKLQNAINSHHNGRLAYKPVRFGGGAESSIFVPTSQDYSLMGAHSTLEVHIMQPAAPVGEEKDFIVRTGETNYFARVCVPIREWPASLPLMNAA